MTVRLWGLVLPFFLPSLPQEFMILPVGASSFSESMAMGVEVYHNLAKASATLRAVL